MHAPREDPPAGTASPGLSTLEVLVVDDEPDVRLGLRRLMESLGCHVRSAADGQGALAQFLDKGADIVLTDLMMPGMTGAELLLEIKKSTPTTEVVILTGFGTVETAVACLRDGAAHFLTKPFDNEEVLEIVGRLGRQVLARNRAAASPEGDERAPIVADDPRMREALALIDRVAPSPLPVLVQGESGTGKELAARRIHERSPQVGRPFRAVNAAALVDNLLESELFGHKKGSFTGADRDREGLFVEARGGTVFLDEISSMSLAFQGKLLRVLEEKVVRPVGSDRDVPVQFRLVAATNRDLEKMIRDGEFREDLYYRVRVVLVRLPPLRERPLDIEPLARHFFATAAKVCLPPDSPLPELSPEALRVLRDHDWPGNARELQNSMQRAIVTCWGQNVLPYHLGLGSDARSDVERMADAGDDYESAKKKVVEGFQRDFIYRALERTRGNVSQAAETCGLTRAAFQRIMRSLDIDREQFLTG